MERYVYDGPVMQFDRCIMNRWQGTTCASSENKAKSNLIYQFKKQNNILPTAKITLAGKVKEE